MYDEDDEEVFLGMSAGSSRSSVSGETARKIDEEVRKIIDECYATATRLLDENVAKLHAMAEALLEYETIDDEQIDDIMNGRPPRPPAGWDDPSEPPQPDPDPTVDEDPAPRQSGSVGGPAGEH